jgi:hypothetical protein
MHYDADLLKLFVRRPTFRRFTGALIFPRPKVAEGEPASLQRIAVTPRTTRLSEAKIATGNGHSRI